MLILFDKQFDCFQQFLICYFHGIHGWNIPQSIDKGTMLWLALYARCSHTASITHIVYCLANTN